MYVGKLLAKPLNIALAGVVLAYLMARSTGLASNFLEFETVIYFAGLTGVEILAAVMAGVIGPNRSLNKIAEGLSLPGESRKLIWKESQDEKVEEKRLDSKEEIEDNEREVTH